MDKIFAFKNAQEFQEIFGVQEHGNGVKSRRNKILLAMYKSPSMWAYCRKRGYNKGFKRFFSIKSMADLKEYCNYFIRKELETHSVIGYKRKTYYPVWLMGDLYWSSQFSTDESNGIPSNRDVGYVRYVSRDEKRNGKVYRMKAGRFYKRLLRESELGRALPEQVLNWLCEEFTNEWSSYVVRKLPHFSLHVDDNFERIYSYGTLDDGVRGCTEDFNSCMMDDDQHVFYQRSVKAKAAYLTNDENRVIARCVIFTDVFDEDGNKWRLAERQYAENGSDLYKRCLVDALVEGGYIDGYKQVGVDCHQTTSYVDKEGKSLSDMRFHIECDLKFSKDGDDAWDNEEDNRILSYQDSFKYFVYKEKVAYNTEPYDTRGILMLDTTNPYIQGVYDDYHGDYCAYVTRVLVHGSVKRCDQDRLEDFVWFNDYYIHKDDCVPCPVCGKPMPDPKYYRGCSFMFYFSSSDGNEYACSNECKRILKVKFEEHSFYDALLGHHVSLEKDTPLSIIHAYFGRLEALTTSASCLQEHIQRRRVSIIDVRGDGTEFIPMYSTGLIDPIARFRFYQGKYPNEMESMISIVRQTNISNGVHSLYCHANELSEVQQ